MANVSNQFYYVDNGKPILKTEYDDGSEDFYDASGQFNGYSWSGVNNGTVIDPYGDMAQQEADSQAAKARSQGYASPSSQGGYADPSQGNATPGGDKKMPNPLKPKPQDPGNPGSQYQAQSPGNVATPGSGPAGATQQQLTDMERYNWSDPQAARTAMLNAFRDQGWSTYNNPYVSRLLGAAGGLQTAFTGQRALQGAGPEATANSYGDFGRFLQQAIGGGNIFGTLQGAQGMFPQIVNAVRGFNQQAGSGSGTPGVVNSNPFAEALSDIMGQGQGQGALTQYGGLFSPFMTNRLGTDYQTLLESAGLDANRRFQEGGNIAQPGEGGNDWWKYIFGY